MESRASLCLDAELPPTGHSMGIPHRELPRLRPPSMPAHARQTFMRWVLVTWTAWFAHQPFNAFILG